MCLLHNPSSVDKLSSGDVMTHFPTSRIALAAASHLPVMTRKNFVTKLMKAENQEAMASGEKSWKDFATSVRV